MAGNMLVSLSPKSVYSLLRSVAGSSALSYSSPNFPNCYSPRGRVWFTQLFEIPLFYFPARKALDSGARSSELRRATCREESHFLFCFLLSLNFMRLPQTFLRSLPLAQTKLPIRCSSTFLALAWIFSYTSLPLAQTRSPMRC